MELLKKTFLGKEKAWTVQLASFDYYQLELEYAYKKSGNKDNVVVSDLVEVKEEKDNKYDENAVTIYFNKLKIGYIPREYTIEYKELKHKHNPRIRLYYYNEKYRSEFLVDYRSK